MRGQTQIFTKSVAKDLRREMTDAERMLWWHLKGEQLGFKFRRQHPFENYILDFVCLERELVIEVDGSQHAEEITHDELRSQKLRNAGFTVLRFCNYEVLNQTESVVQAIWDALNPSPPQPSP